MKNFFLAIVTVILIVLLGTAIYIYNNPKVIDKTTNQDKKDTKQDNRENDSVDKTRNSSSDTNTKGYDETNPINEMTQDEYDRYLLSQKRSYLTKEQQERYDELLIMKGSTPAENDEKNKAYNGQQRRVSEGSGGGTALITPPETEEEKERIRKIQEEQVKQRQAEYNNSEQSQQAEQGLTQQTQQKRPRQLTQEFQKKVEGPVDNSERKIIEE